LSAGKLSKTEGGGRAEAKEGGGGHFKAWMPPDVGTLPEPEGEAYVLSLWNIGATMQNISFEYFWFYNKCWGGEKEIYKKESTYSECLL